MTNCEQGKPEPQPCERTMFEARIRKAIADGMHGWNLKRDSSGDYEHPVIYNMWAGWICRAAASQPLVPTGPVCPGGEVCDGDLPGEWHEKACPCYKEEVDGVAARDWDNRKGEIEAEFEQWEANRGVSSPTPPLDMKRLAREWMIEHDHMPNLVIKARGDKAMYETLAAFARHVLAKQRETDAK